MGLAENDDQRLGGVVLHQADNTSRNAQVASSNAAHVAARMTVHAINMNAQFAGGFEYGFVTTPVAAPLLVVPNAIQELLFRNRSRHPLIQNFLISREYRFDGNSDFVFVLCNFLEQIHD